MMYGDAIQHGYGDSWSRVKGQHWKVVELVRLSHTSDVEWIIIDDLSV